MIRSNLCEWEIKEDIGILKIVNPPQNVLLSPDFVDLNDLKGWLDNAALKGLIITGEGRHFSSGADLDTIYKDAKADLLFNKIEEGKKILTCIEGVSIPTVAAIKGACFGGGLEIALSSHIRVCSEKSIFAFPETDLGLMPGLGGTIRLPHLAGFSNSLDMILNSDMMNAEKALELRIVDYLVPTNEVFDFSYNLLKRLTKNRSVDVINSVIKSLNNSQRMPMKIAMEEETKMFCKLAIEEAGRDL